MGMNKIALVTGGSRGIGAKTAEFLSLNGYTVAVNYLNNSKKACEICNNINGLALCADVADYNQVLDMVNAIIQKYGKIDLLVNNAAISATGLFTDISECDADRIFDVNVKGTLNCAKAVLPHMINRKSGKIINISSMWGEVGASCEVHYSTSKAAVIGFTKALAKEVAPSNIQVNCITPGIIATAMNADFSPETMESLIKDTPLGRLGSPEDVAEIILFLASEKADFITGQVIGVDGGFN